MSTPRKIPINRVNKFFGKEDFDLEISFARESIEGDGNFVVILYRVDRNTSSFDDLYGEAMENGINYLPPIELRVVPTLEEAKNKSYNDDGSLRFREDGNLSFHIYSQQLSELNVEITYGDYIGYIVNETEVRYYSVTDDGLKNYDNEHTIMGYKGAYRTIKCAPVDESEFSGV